MAPQPNDLHQAITIKSKGRSATLALTGDALRVEREGESKWRTFVVPFRNVVRSEFVNGSLDVWVLAQAKKKSSFSLVRLTREVEGAQKDEEAQFTEKLTELSYKGPQKPRKLKVLVNPHSGPGKAASLFKQKIEPLFRAAQCTLDVVYTTHRNHATEIVRQLPLGEFDAIVVVSGDGLIHEVFNGLSQHKDPITALRTPVAPIPAGSGNGFTLNLLGLEEGTDLLTAALNAVKGRPMPIDLFSLTQKDTRVFSFMSQCVGLMAELDLWTEHLRFMGNTRFQVGYLTGLIKRRACPIKIQIKVAQGDKKLIYETFKEQRSRAVEEFPQDTSEPVADADSPSAIPPLKYTSTVPDAEGWITFEKPISYMYAGKGPYVSVDLMAFPASLPNDGCIDIVLQERTSRGEMLAGLETATTGGGFWRSHQHYYKAEAYRIEPLSDKSCLSVDGEAFPFEPFQVEVHKGLARVLSPYGYYAADFHEPPKKA